jgi:4-hydroxybenzoate polyprenyltransferase
MLVSVLAVPATLFVLSKWEMIGALGAFVVSLITVAYYENRATVSLFAGVLGTLIFYFLKRMGPAGAAATAFAS